MSSDLADLTVNGCAYCGAEGTFMVCCERHEHTGMCAECRRVPKRPAWHNSPVEGRACCGRKSWSSTCEVCVAAVRVWKKKAA